jgi:calcineurin-like phosphoesterase family protein
MNIFFTSDTHFSHAAIIRYCTRPFLTVEEMDEAIIGNWNSKIKHGDRVYHLGDFAWGQREQILALTKRLNGHVILLEGNHDNIGQPQNYGFSQKHKLLDIRIEKMHLTLSHYCMRVWNKSHFDSVHLFGHSHGKLDPIGKSWDVGVDNNNFMPLEFEEIKKIMKSRPHNFNCLEKLKGIENA